MDKNRSTEKKVNFWPFPLFVDGFGQDQQQHPTVHNRGVSRVPFCSPSAHLPFPFRSPFAPLHNFETLKHRKSKTQIRNSKLRNLAILNCFQPFQLFSAVFCHFKLLKMFSVIFSHFNLVRCLQTC